MFTDECRSLVFERIRQFDLRQFARFLTPVRFAAAASRAALKIGTNPLNLPHLVWLGIAAARHRGESFAGVLSLALRILRDSESFRDSQLAPPAAPPRRDPKRSKHDPRGRDPLLHERQAAVPGTDAGHDRGRGGRRHRLHPHSRRRAGPFPARSVCGKPAHHAHGRGSRLYP